MGKRNSLQTFISTLDERPSGYNEGAPLVTIVMPTYNQAAFIERSINSVLNQSYPNVELIVVDGGSSDGTVAILEKLSNRLGYWVSEKDNGQSDALNKGFSQARGEIMGWLNSDDLYLPDAIETAVAVLQKHPEKTVVFGDWWSIDAEDRVLEEHSAFDFDLKHFVYEGFTHNAQGMFWRVDAQRRFGLFDENLHRTMDYDLIVRLGVVEGESAFVRVEQPLACFRRHDNQKTQGFDVTVAREHQRIATRIGHGAKFSLQGRLIRARYRARRAVWYAKRRGFLYMFEQAKQSITTKIRGPSDDGN